MQKNKIFVYQILTRLFGNKNSRNKPHGTIEENGSGKFNDITDIVLNELKEAGYTHVWYIGALAHASATDYTEYGIPRQFPEIVKGKAGSPYAIRDCYDVDPDLAVNVKKRMQEFEELVARTHNAGLNVLIDFVPNHVARNYQSIAKPKHVEDFGEKDDTSVVFAPHNNFYYLPGQPLDLQFLRDKGIEVNYVENPAKATGNDCFANKPSEYDWYDTVKLNYGVDYLNERRRCFDPIPNTWKKMRDILFFWAAKDIDGFRCDMAEMVPLEFWKWVIPQIKAQFPDIIFFAEIYNPSVYRDFLADNTFDYLYDKVGLYDVLRDVACGYRPSSDITFILNAVGDIQHRMINFMENHDEQRIASDFFLKSGEKGKAAMIVTACINVNPVMIYFGQELGERGMDEEGFSGKDGRTSIFDYWSVDTVRRWNNNGKWNEELLTEEEIRLRKFYHKLIRLCNREKALREGLFYDLMYANYENPDFNSMKQYAFVRGDYKDFLLVIANFSNEEEEVTVWIPDHAYDFFKVNQHERAIAVPLLAEEKFPIDFSWTNPLKVKIKANEGEIYKISFL
ncbi:MAG: alpha-amylase family glycosyl hydrolase [Dysgonamonadaceae bacterium]|jgi:glycosidase|nr:alpha-amylase family glycosyl hydrolase [Dysgonamonadaceae bacterium]